MKRLFVAEKFPAHAVVQILSALKTQSGHPSDRVGVKQREGKTFRDTTNKHTPRLTTHSGDGLVVSLPLHRTLVCATGKNEGGLRNEKNEKRVLRPQAEGLRRSLTNLASSQFRVLCPTPTHNEHVANRTKPRMHTAETTICSSGPPPLREGRWWKARQAEVL